MRDLMLMLKAVAIVLPIVLLIAALMVTVILPAIWPDLAFADYCAWYWLDGWPIQICWP